MPGETKRTHTVSIELDATEEAELVELAEHSDVSKDDVLREAIRVGLEIAKAQREADLAPPDPSWRKEGRFDLDDDIPF